MSGQHHQPQPIPTEISLRVMVGYLIAHDCAPPSFTKPAKAPEPAAGEPVRVESYRRNWPCLCGSGKKFKHCCLNRNR